MSEAPRYALYAAPPASSALWRFGSGVVGYDAVTGADLAPPEGLSVDAATWIAWTEEPRRYGFHATLKAPFSLAEGVSERELVAATGRVATRLVPAFIPELVLAALGPFVALIPAGPAPAAYALADECVRSLEPLRRALSPEDRARRLRSPLTPRQIDYVDRYGYPYVLEEFRFHMTLTGALPHENRELVRGELARRYASLPAGFALDDVVLFRQADRDSRFRVLVRIPCGG